MFIQWGHPDQFNVGEIRLLAKEGDLTPLKVLRIETREVRRKGRWGPTYTLYDDQGHVVGHYLTLKDVDVAIDLIIKELN